MASCSPSMKRYLSDTLIPISFALKDVHAMLENEVDVQFSNAVLTFDEVCKRVEALVLQDGDDTKNIFSDVKARW
jgi:hypothetical protein